jgi:putative oxidoreductase
MKTTSTISRYLLGLLFFLAGAAGLFNLMPQPTDLPADMLTFMSGLMVTKYFFPFLKLTEMVCGALLIVRIAPALMLLILAPITIHIFFVHAFLTPGIQNLGLPIVILVLHALASVNYWHLFRPLLQRA